MITRPGQSYQVWRVWMWSRSLDNEEAQVHSGLLRHGEKKNIVVEQKGGDSICDIGITENRSFLLLGNTLRIITIYRSRKEYFWGQILL